MSSKERRTQLTAILTCIAIYGFTLGLVHPLLSLILESRGVDRTLIGVNAAMPAFGILLTSTAIPFLIRRFGIKPFLMTAFLSDLVLFLMFPLFDKLYAWFAIRFLMGISTNALMVTSETWINEATADESRGRVLGLYSTILAASVALGPMVIPIAGIAGWAPFLVGAFFILLAAIPLIRITPISLDVDTKSSFGIFSFVYIAPVIVLSMILFSWKEYAAAALLPVYGVRLGMSESTAAATITIMGIGGVCLAYPIGWLADKFNRYLLLMLCGVGAAIGALLLPFVFSSHLALWPLLFFWGGCFAGLYAVALTVVGQRFRGNELVMANVSIGIVWGVGSLTGPSITGMAMDIWDPQGFPGVFFMGSTLFVLIGAIRWVLTSDKTKAL